MKTRLTLLAVLLVPVCGIADWQVISWAGNTEEWNRRLGVSEVRMGCSGAPDSCLKSLRSVSRREGVPRITLAISSDAETLAAYAAEYGRVSKSEPVLRGIGLDDFLRVLRRWQRSIDDEAIARLLRTAIDGAKEGNPQLQFGITLYEDELDSPLLASGMLPPDVRKGVGRVSLYVHHRQSAPRYADDVARVRKLFPEAAVVAGVYAYDRSRYSSCADDEKRRCTLSEEKALFGELFERQVEMLTKGQIDGIEFYPGQFGLESDWKGWTNPKICGPEQRQQCIDTTLEMRRFVEERLQSQRGNATE